MEKHAWTGRLHDDDGPDAPEHSSSPGFLWLDGYNARLPQIGEWPPGRLLQPALPRQRDPARLKALCLASGASDAPPGRALLGIGGSTLGGTRALKAFFPQPGS